ncbi:hypothetical protein DNTS_025768, partial [Danionella cerebrum]
MGQTELSFALMRKRSHQPRQRCLVSQSHIVREPYPLLWRPRSGIAPRVVSCSSRATIRRPMYPDDKSSISTLTTETQHINTRRESSSRAAQTQPEERQHSQHKVDEQQRVQVVDLPLDEQRSFLQGMSGGRDGWMDGGIFAHHARVTLEAMEKPQRREETPHRSPPDWTDSSSAPEKISSGERERERETHLELRADGAQELVAALSVPQRHKLMLQIKQTAVRRGSLPVSDDDNGAHLLSVGGAQRQSVRDEQRRVLLLQEAHAAGGNQDLKHTARSVREHSLTVEQLLALGELWEELVEGFVVFGETLRRGREGM